MTVTSLIIISSCRKINDATTLGKDLIPVVDNITTFDTTLDVEAYNGLFDNVTDTLKLSHSEEYMLGNIDAAHADPFFGTTDARLFLEMKPAFYKYFFIAAKDSMDLDSTVLCLNWKDTYGDTNVAQHVNVYEIDQSTDFRYDSAYRIRQNTFTYSNLLGSRTFSPSILNDSVKAYKDTTANMLRIPLNASFGNKLLKQFDSVGTSGPSAAYVSDSLFRTNFKGFALQSTQGKAIMGFNLSGTNTKLALYFRYTKNGVRDTTVVYFTFNSLSASANYVIRNYSGKPIEAAQGGTSPDNMVYIQTQPGSYATLKIPGLSTISNRLVHRAELITEQVYDPSDTIFRVPTYLYLDAYDPAISNYRTIPYDLSFDQSGSVNISTFGMSPLNTIDPFSNNVKQWKFNITRYVQHVLTRTEPNYDLRLFAPFFVEEKYRIPGTTTDNPSLFIINPAIVMGRVRLAGGTPGTQRMRLRIIYSKL